jgi:hypothetical protein
MRPVIVVINSCNAAEVLVHYSHPQYQLNKNLFIRQNSAVKFNSIQGLLINMHCKNEQ